MHPGFSSCIVYGGDHPLQMLGQLGRLDAAQPAKPGCGRHSPRANRGDARLVELHDPPVDSGQATTQISQVLADTLCQRLGYLTPSTVVPQHLATARLLDRCGQGPRPDHLGLERTAHSLRQLLDGVEVLGQQRDGSAMVDAAGIDQAPTRWL